MTGTNVGGNGVSLIRLKADGSIDPAVQAIVGHAGTVRDIVRQPDGKYLGGGSLSTVNGIPRKGYARLNADGSLDTSFNINGGANSTVWRINLQTDNKVLIAGDFMKVANVAAIGVARLDAAAAKTPFDYDGDGKTDFINCGGKPCSRFII